MFSGLSISLCVGGGISGPMSFPGDISGTRSLQEVGMSMGLGMSEGGRYRPGQRIAGYGRQASGTHPAGMLSCCF